MGRGSKTTEFLKECMADALLKLMQEKPMERISIQEITALAGVGRSTWFRNFSTKNEALSFKLLQLWCRWGPEHGMGSGTRYTVDNVGDFFQFNYEHRDVLLALYESGQQTAIYDAFFQIMMPQFDDAEAVYESRFLSYGLFGLLGEWMKRDFKETPEEMASISKKFIFTTI